ncbi:hypothetical protein K493DRAFT_302735 [Basidiobolus meristosporus CBS 931.73]|uniref:CASTOR ACT domain-containing protein n=1 Tax=Basidiobolus meristosporus CBS 931.73 TaxID=1314790 RepID=A0A1Y1Y5X8_9FUNG|nr:hypothetical protein K493DRAFT_302735 [Basidiobolus meristosporus CBS 931.73]|eukprot:ORX93369.1 hypothetical protein K493DRAFT_302735 [Basidiobolus meristosporus CBS 931.73]
MSDLEVCILPGKDFFSFTETPLNISLIVDEAAVESFPPEAKVDVSPTVFIPFQILTGQSGTVPVLHSIAVPLANNGISILQLSTYETDYTLIPEELVKKALSCFPPTFVIRDESRLFEDAIPNFQSPFYNAKRNSVNGSCLSMQLQDGEKTDGDQWINPEFLSKIATSEQITNLRRVVSFPDCPVYVTSLVGSVEAVQNTMSIPLINLLFYSDDRSFSRERGDRFFSFTRTAENASLILSEPCLSLFPPGSLNFCGGSWSILKIEDVAFAFEQCGIVRDFTEKLKNLGISIFYLTTYHTDYLLVNQEDYHAVMNALVHYDSTDISGH